MSSEIKTFPVSSQSRRLLAGHLHGTGLEVGGLQTPLHPLENIDTIYYMDRFDTDTLREHYPELAQFPLVDVELIGDVEKLPFASNSLDFVIINHVIEHIENFIHGLRGFSRVIKPGGFLFMAVPDKRYTFDLYREPTEYEHFIHEFHNGTNSTRREHFLEWSRDVNGKYFQMFDSKDDEAVQKRLNELWDINYSIHFHVWAAENFVAHILRLYHEQYIDLRLHDFAAVEKDSNEFVVVLQKVSRKPKQHSIFKLLKLLKGKINF